VEVQLEVPDEVATHLRDQDRAAKANEAFMMELLREHAISQGKAAELLGIGRHTLLDVMAQYQVPVVDMTPEELEQALQRADALLREQRMGMPGAEEVSREDWLRRRSLTSSPTALNLPGTLGDGARHVEELMEERGVLVDHATLQRWVVQYSPLLEEAFHRHKRPVWVSWRMDETYIKVKGHWYDL
jgi:predicted HTH domain antitoxin